MSRTNIASKSVYGKQIGFSRAVRIGNIIAVSGTAPIAPDGSTASPGDLYGQTTRCLDIIRGAIEEAGGKTLDIVRTRVFLTDISRWQEAGRAHGDYFRDIMPACTFVEVKGLIDKSWLVEIEADCVNDD
jgi:enamine deaminase RidA (YjgF/YER057c/UK114 family)